jgi:hypothetical protein
MFGTTVGTALFYILPLETEPKASGSDAAASMSPFDAKFTLNRRLQHDARGAEIISVFTRVTNSYTTYESYE